MGSPASLRLSDPSGRRSTSEAIHKYRQFLAAWHGMERPHKHLVDEAMNREDERWQRLS